MQSTVGLKAERVNVGDNMPKLDSLDRVSPEQAAAVLEGMKHCAFWKVTPSGTAALPSTETEGFRADASMQSGKLSLALTGRLDTITAPSLLSFFEKAKAEQAPDAVEVDCSGLEYISSAGLRVLLIMHKACTGGVKAGLPFTVKPRPWKKFWNRPALIPFSIDKSSLRCL